MEPLPFPTFPSFVELVDLGEPKVEERDHSLFQTYLGGRVEDLLDDARRDPECPAEEMALLVELYSGRKPTPAEMEVLNRRTYEFLTRTPTKTVMPTPRIVREEPDEEPDLEHGETYPRPYWWL